MIQSPYDLEARYSTKRETHWVGFKVHVTETCDEQQPRLITQVVTTAATTPDSTMGPPLQQDLADRGLLPGVHLLDQGYVDADLIVTARTKHQVDVVGPVPGTHSRQAREGQGYALQAFTLDWAGQQARCPQGHASVKWTPGHDMTGQAVIRIRFDQATCRDCPVRAACTWAQHSPRQLTVRPQEHHAAIEAARRRQETDDFKTQYAARAGIESCLSQGVRRFDLRQSRYRGLARTSLQQLFVVLAMNLVRIGERLRADGVAPRERAPGRFLQLAPQRLSHVAAA